MLRAALLAALMAVTTSSAARAQDRAGGVKAAILYNLARFTTWPGDRFSSPSDPVELCVEATEPFARDLKALEGKTIGARRLTVRTTAWPFNPGCEMAYVSAERATEANLRILAARGVLTVGESEGFAKAGAIRLIIVGRQVRFEINKKVADSAGAALSAQLLNLALRVH